MQNLFLFLAGIGLFLLAMNFIEGSLRKLAGRRFKLFLRRHTDSTPKAIISSTILTTLLQSSSVVIMTILSFVGAGIVSMHNALAVTLGSNIGTTLANWIIALVGFKMDISIVALPLVALGAAAVAFTDELKKIHQAARLLIAFGFLFLGLNFMKESMTVVFENFDFSRFENYPLIVFVLIGFVMTGLIQSSSATVAILLSALSTGAIPFEPAVAAVIGSELGTALKVIFGSLKGSAPKRQMAVGNFTFNIIISILAFIFIHPLIALSTSVFGEGEILLRLVLFQTVMNVAGVIIFAPALSVITRFLEKYIKDKSEPSSFVVGEKLLKVPGMAIDAIEQDTELLIHRVLRLNLEAFATTRKLIHSEKHIDETLNERNRRLSTYEKKYEDIKKSEGEILIYALKLNDEFPEHAERIEVLVSAIRHAMHSAKAMKDVYHNRIEFHESADDVKFRHYIDFRKQLESFYTQIDKHLTAQKRPSFEGLVDLALKEYHERRDKIYEAARKEKLVAEDVSSLLNVNRELYTSGKTVVQALQLFHSSESSKKIGEVP
jgi:phosphate:Na+ symporter